jgi:hypothetical protein
MAVTSGPAARGSNERVRRGVLLLALAACSQAPNAVTLVPVIDGPVDDIDATPTGLDTIEMSVAHEGGAQVKSQVFKRGQALQLAGLQFGDNLVVHLWGPDRDPTDNIAYGRTCAFSVAADAPVATPHLFFSRKVRFATVDLRPRARVGGLAIPYQGGALLVAGHGGGSDPVTAVESFVPSTGELITWDQMIQRDQAVQALYTPANGPQRALVIGGAAGNLGASNIEVIQGRNIEAVQAPDMGRIELTATAEGNGNVLVVGGRPPGGAVVGDLDEIRPTNDNDTQPNAYKLAVKLATPRSRHTATLVGDQFASPILIAGGLDATGKPVDLAEVYRPLSQELVSSAMMRHPRYGHAAVAMFDGSVLIIGGLDASGPVLDIERFTLDGGFVLYPNALRADQGVIDFTITALPDHRVLVTGGRTSATGDMIDRAYVIELKDGTPLSTPTDSLAMARAGHQAVLLCDGSVLITGGTPLQSPAERYNPPDTGRQ